MINMKKYCFLFILLYKYQGSQQDLKNTLVFVAVIWKLISLILEKNQASLIKKLMNFIFQMNCTRMLNVT